MINSNHVPLSDIANRCKCDDIGNYWDMTFYDDNDKYIVRLVVKKINVLHTNKPINKYGKGLWIPCMDIKTIKYEK